MTSLSQMALSMLSSSQPDPTQQLPRPSVKRRHSSTRPLPQTIDVNDLEQPRKRRVITDSQNALSEQLRQHVLEMRELRLQVAREHQAIRAAISHFDTCHMSIRASIRNAARRKANAKALVNSSLPLRALCKETTGIGSSVDGIGLDEVQQVIASATIGSTVAGSVFPKNLDELLGMSRRRINVLQSVYNESFGIVATDSVEMMRAKFLNWIVS
jgi:hypothetical protein